jgi:FkbM family methyltransferase
VNFSAVIKNFERIPELARARRETPAWTEVAMRYLEMGTHSYPFCIPLCGGGTVKTGCLGEVKVFWQIFVRRCYSIPFGCTTIVDVGGNIGLFGLWAAREWPAARIISVEPFPETFQRMEENVRLNYLQERILCVQRALAGETRERQMSAWGDDSPTRHLILHGPTRGDGRTLTVPCSTLADFLEEQRLGAVDLLKMDAEGSEWEILFATPASVLRKIRYILLEYHEVHARLGFQPDKLFAHLSSAGHKLNCRTEDRGGTGLAFLSLTE